jgi:beta-lactamase class A
VADWGLGIEWFNARSLARRLGAIAALLLSNDATTLAETPESNAIACKKAGQSMDRRAALIGLTSWASSRAIGSGAHVTPAFVGPLSQGLVRLGETTPGTLCVAIRDLSTGQEVTLNGDAPCPMHSVVKIFVGAFAARELDAGRWQEDQMVMLSHATAANGHGRIDQRVARAGTLLVSVSDMLEAMLIDSDNISADGLIRLAGGPAAVHAGLNLPAGVNMSQSLRDQLKPFGVSKSRTTYDAFMADPRDQATPRAFMMALARLANGRLGSANGDRRVLELMLKAWRGTARIPAGLGRDWLTFGRTGTGQPVGGRTTGVHNVVIARHKVTGRKIAIVAFLKDARGGLGGQEAALARVGRAVRDAWPAG